MPVGFYIFGIVVILWLLLINIVTIGIDKTIIVFGIAGVFLIINVVVDKHNKR